MTDLGAMLQLVRGSAIQKHYPLAILRTRIFPAIWLGQYRILWHQGRPVGFYNWAWLDETLAERYRRTQCHVEPDQWVGGSCLWFMEMVHEPGQLRAVVRSMRTVVPAGTVANWHEVSAIGEARRQVRQVRFRPAGASPLVFPPIRSERSAAS
ncbi:toxin-activating lysine-acyltransferase [Leptothrix discophora]|uniref:RTX toxin-activating lysine-acyltransferase n=1 Tax=Leptothrix discophora TaxID=89 RepID=A0ABT9FYI9_LEPDI|nr:toxin-activating lysine-acyltransferase [Leptothrix discophora]MDP4299288.1 toxin-activating lysine-acyltransferase [Leptothrix discophora]